jgi:hypothetical protein
MGEMVGGLEEYSGMFQPGNDLLPRLFLAK